MNVSPEFQRARRPEQQQARRTAILEAAAEMLSESPVNDISLRELSKRVGLAKSNVLRYFESREAVFLELLNGAWREWLLELSTELADAEISGTPNQRCRQLGTTIAHSLDARPLTCELISVLAGVLERNISVEVAKRFKLSAAENTETLAALGRRYVPELQEAGAVHFAGATFVMVAGLWPLTNPAESVRTALSELKLDSIHVTFLEGMSEALTVHLIGLVAMNLDPLTARPEVRPMRAARLES